MNGAVSQRVLHGMGIGLFPEDSHILSRHLAALPIAEMAETHDDCLIALKSKQHMRKVESSVDLVDQFEFGSGSDAMPIRSSA